jgi:6-phosphogluconolactonase/glucosamine-6-phosphate isomerase/deaminase
MAEYVGSCWRELQNKEATNSDFIVASPLSSTPLPIYRWVLSNTDKFQNWSQFRFLLMDEQIEDSSELSYVSLSDEASYEAFARDKFLTPLSVAIRKQVEDFLIKPSLTEFSNLDDRLKKNKGLDILILAFGEDGHYAQVMPGTAVSTGFHVSKLSAALSELHTKPSSISYPNATFRKRGMSLGPLQVLEAKNVFVIASGKSKAKAASELLSLNDFNIGFPISIVHHPNVRDRVQFCYTNDCVI